MKNSVLYDQAPPKALHCPSESLCFWLPLLIISFFANPLDLISATDDYPDIEPLLRLKNQNMLIYDNDTIKIVSSHVTINLLEIISDTLAIYEVEFYFLTNRSQPKFLDGFSSFSLLADVDKKQLKSEIPFCQRIPHIPNGLYTLHDEGVHQPDSLLSKRNSADLSSIDGRKKHKIEKGRIHISSHRGFTNLSFGYQLDNGKILSGRLSKKDFYIYYTTGLDLKVCDEWWIVMKMQWIVFFVFLVALYVLPHFLKKPKKVNGW